MVIEASLNGLHELIAVGALDRLHVGKELLHGVWSPCWHGGLLKQSSHARLSAAPI
jgi:hypothetical protein